MLEDLISEDHEKMFFQEFWTKKPMFLKGTNPEGFSHILSKDNVDQIISTSNLSTMDLKVLDAQNARMLQLTEEEKKRDPYHYYGEGLPLIIENLFNCWYPIAELCRKIEIAMRAKNLFCTTILVPKRAIKFSYRFQKSDVFILNTSGNSEMKIYSEKSEEAFSCRDGDFFYIPKNYCFDVTATNDSSSIFVIIGYISSTWSDFFRSIIENLWDDPDNSLLRRSLPREVISSEKIFGTTGGSEEEMRQLLKKLSETISDQKNFFTLKKEFLKGFAYKHVPILKGQLSAMHELESLGLDSTVQKNKNVYVHIEENPSHIRCYCGRDLLTLPIDSAESVEHLFSGDVIRIRDIQGPLPSEEKCQLAVEALRHGMIEIIHNNAPKSEIGRASRLN